MSLRTAIVGTSLSVVIGFAHPFAQVPDRDEFEASTRPLSPSVAGTFLMRERRIESGALARRARLVKRAAERQLLWREGHF